MRPQSTPTLLIRKSKHNEHVSPEHSWPCASKRQYTLSGLWSVVCIEYCVLCYCTMRYSPGYRPAIHAKPERQRGHLDFSPQPMRRTYIKSLPRPSTLFFPHTTLHPPHLHLHLPHHIPSSPALHPIDPVGSCCGASTLALLSVTNFIAWIARPRSPPCVSPHPLPWRPPQPSLARSTQMLKPSWPRRPPPRPPRRPRCQISLSSR